MPVPAFVRGDARPRTTAPAVTPSHPHRPQTLRIVTTRGPATSLAAGRTEAAIARIVRHGPPDAIVATARLRHPSADALFARARSLWPGLDARALARTRGDLQRIARLVGRRTALPETTIMAMLTATR